jgi:hypothetical protein
VITVYGCDWCEDTRRSLRHLRRLGVAHHFTNIDEDLDALERALALNAGRRLTPVIDLGLGGAALVEPDNDTLTGALVEMEMLTQEDVHTRMGVQNVGDVERAVRTVAGTVLIAGSAASPRPLRGPLAALGAIVALTGVTGWCPAYHAARLTSLDGPGDRPGEAARDEWLAPRAPFPSATEGNVEEPAR